MITYDCGDPVDVPINGISIRQMRQLYKEVTGGEDTELTYKGGEFIGLRNDMIPRLLDFYRVLWKYNYSRYLNHEVKLNEEAHFLSLVYERLGISNCAGNKYMKRMWTAVRYDNVAREDAALAIWHLPAEKKYAFGTVFHWLRCNPTEQEYTAYVKKLLKIPGSRTRRVMRKLGIKLKEKLGR